ncbi:cyclic nucleotide-binding domain-containing protein [Rhodopseudomonas boonkerdii]|uniref:cyclic nucleotide-binding domain-containing protein n=1 Tax=Rhodopseudomonas boonkerdii TaxID=475937 RepID=UPI001E332F06|nr:cyclic nucleotide-binding domain-containing protein [Rhodopseudomonas boonkerdii]UGV24431.1 cyclic nucleotide-binding domain-containing protein [Rhodopseudomonas boonkerdii]
MSIDDDVSLLERVPTLRLLGRDALRVIAIGSEQQEFARGSFLFREDEPADCGYVVQSGAFRISVDDGSGHEVVAGRGALIGELSLLISMPRRSTAVATEYSSVIRITRSLFQRVLDSDPDAALRLRNDMAARVNELTSDFVQVRAKLG